ncbi:hypothetical protein CYMTET_28259 [Cymbomonas tetramitiformis]|uniref:Uncharacterized protein n=1 Tax=Cymbomonas tetramitiformis TaxID=36881 RepID=A0AAE0FND9_9CHLO|nr:hypothetical protein CYMTET_28259 [Cymbomonas tetramitiformis]|eukprot:gene15311-18115_t
MGCFFLGHYLNIWAFTHPSDEQSRPPSATVSAARSAFLAAPFLACYVAALVILFSLTDKLRSSTILSIAVPIYGLALVAACWRAVHRYVFTYHGESPVLWRAAAYGYCLYVCSDSLIAFDKFSYALPEPSRTLAVMLTYLLGQLLISVAIDVARPEHSLYHPIVTTEEE